MNVVIHVSSYFSAFIAGKFRSKSETNFYKYVGSTVSILGFSFFFGLVLFSLEVDG